tara:strand:- start:1518 stop:1805 length:288 start_codon:yes stop_codon:yes gene_type:complete
MPNGNKMVDGKLVEMTDAEQTEFESSETDAKIAARRIWQLRAQRDRRLAKCDYMGNQDFSITDAWKTYRQALRDITDQTPSDDALSNINWPTEPS